MSFATETLTKIQAAYQNAVTGKSVALNGRRWEQHDISQLRNELDHWQRVVDKETALASGKRVNHALRVVV